MLTKERLLKDLDHWFKESGDERFLTLFIGLATGHLTTSEVEDARHKIQFPELYQQVNISH